MMADFALSYDRVIGEKEGGYSKHRADRGGETYKGVSRLWWPGWPGWPIVDVAKAQAGFPANLEQDVALQRFVRMFYRDQFWNRFLGERIPDQSLADELFDQGVNMGVHKAVDNLQRDCNLLNRSDRTQPLFPDLKRDGGLGPTTLEAVNVLISQRDGARLVKGMNRLQHGHYVALIESDRTQEAFYRGWLDRT